MDNNYIGTMQNSWLMPSCGCDVAALTLGVWEAALSVAGSWDKGGGTMRCTDSYAQLLGLPNKIMF